MKKKNKIETSQINHHGREIEDRREKKKNNDSLQHLLES